MVVGGNSMALVIVKREMNDGDGHGCLIVIVGSV